MTRSRLFIRYVGQTSPAPMMIDVERAEGIYIYSPDGKRYIDLISGVAVSNVGHSNKEVVEAVCRQAQDYMHLMVYGEYLQSPQIDFANKIGEYLPKGVDSIYFVNSGSEAIEGALKLAKRHTNRSEIFSFKNAYHGSTHGALSIMGDEYFKSAYRPLLPDVKRLELNNIEQLSAITERTAAVVIEPIQGEAGFRASTYEFLSALRRRCDEMGALLIFDEIQSGFGRTGKMFAWEKIGVAPDIICMAKAMGGGMPLGGFTAPLDIMNDLTHNPVLGHITTFGGHPVSCAAGLASLNFIEREQLCDTIEMKSNLFVKRLSKHKEIQEIRSCGLMIAVDLGNQARRDEVVSALVSKGLLTEGFLFCETAFRIAPPLTITEEQIEEICDIISDVLQ